MSSNHKPVRLSKEETEEVKEDLLMFVHNVAKGDFTSPEQVSTLCNVVELLAKYFSS